MVDSVQSPHRSQLFTVRLWAEEVSAAAPSGGAR